MEAEEAKGIIEALLFVAERPLTLDALFELFAGEVDRPTLRACFQELKEVYQGRGIELTEVAKGYQLCTRPQYADWVRRFLGVEHRTRLSQPALETLAIIAYRQPITRQEIEAIRGVDVSGVIRTLLEKELIRVMGKKKVAGRPLMYGSSTRFLEHFGLKDLSDLPSLEQLSELASPDSPAVREQHAAAPSTEDPS